MTTKHISFKLYARYESDKAIQDFLQVCNDNGLKNTDIVKLALNRLITDVSQGLITDVPFPQELIFQPVETKNEPVEDELGSIQPLGSDLDLDLDLKSIIKG